MLTSFFGKSKPVNFLISGLYIFVGAMVFFFFNTDNEMNIVQIGSYMISVGACIFSVLLLDFMIRKNGLTLSNNYAIVLFAAFLIMFAALFNRIDFVFANVFIMLAFRRIFSLASLKNTKVKILDASLWISIAAIFYFWSLLIFVVLYIAILKNKKSRYRYFLIPPIGFGVVLILAATFFILKDDSLIRFQQWIPTLEFNFQAYNSISLLIPMAFYITLIIWTGFSRFGKLSLVPKKDRVNYTMVFYVLYATIAMAFLVPNKNGSELIFTFLPVSIMVTNYLERLNENWFREILVWANLLLPIILFVI